ncbi:hypothetical protein PSTT_04463, partial [Puccinia striiformis]
SMINSYLNLASHDPESINTAHSPKDKETLSDEDNSSSSSESESLPHDGLSTLSSPAPTVVVPFKCIVGYSLQLEDRKRGHKSTWEAAKSPAATKMYIDVNHNKQSFEEFKIAAADVCNTLLPGIGLMIGKAGKKNIPKIEWQAFIPNNKGGNLARCTLEAQPLIIDGPTSDLRLLLQRVGAATKLNHTLEDYLTFIGCVSPEAERVSSILRRNGFISYHNFASPSLNNEYLTAVELPLGLVIRLRDSVSGFFNHLSQNST